MNDTSQINVGGVLIGGGAPVSIQSMTNTNTADVAATVGQILRLEEAGCDIVRVAVPDTDAAEAISEIKQKIHIPLVADIHFDYRLAIKAAQNGVDKIRINPGNVGSEDRVKKIADICKERGIPIRIGVNGGSVSKKILEKYGKVTAEALVESALTHIELLEKYDFTDICISMKATDVPMTIESYRLMRKVRNYPLHIGITHTGTVEIGKIKSAVGIGILLYEGLGDTMRVSLAADPVEEIKTGINILKAMEIRKGGPEIIACPTCGRCKIDLIKLTDEVEKRLIGIKKDVKVAVMGCAVNGPGEAREADVGIAGGVDSGLIFCKGKIIRKVPQKDIVDELMKQIELL